MSADPVVAPSDPAACPSCGATVRSDVDWCTLCYASLLPAPCEPKPAADAVQLQLADGAGQPDAPPPDVAVQRLFAELAATADRGSPWASRLPRGPAGKAIVMIGGGAAASLLLLALMALIGLFL